MFRVIGIMLVSLLVPMLPAAVPGQPADDLHWIGTIQEIPTPHGVALSDDGSVFVGSGDGEIFGYDRDRRLLGRFGQGVMSSVVGLATGRHGVVYAVDPGRARVEMFSPDGLPLGGWGSFGSGHGQFDNPYFLAVDRQGNVLVVDGGNRRVQVFGPEGQFLRSWETHADVFNPSAFQIPSGIAVHPTGDIFVADLDGRIQRFNADGERLSSWRAGYGTHVLYGLACDAQGNVYAVHRYNHLVLKFSETGVLLAIVGGHGQHPGQFDQPFSAAVSHSGLVYVTDRGNHRVEVFSKNPNASGPNNRDSPGK